MKHDPRPYVERLPYRIRARHAGLDWERASLLWRPEALELRIPLHLDQGAMATFPAAAIWSQAPPSGMRREIWNGWLALASPTLLDEVDPVELERQPDGAAKHASDVRGREHGRIEDFTRRLRDAGTIAGGSGRGRGTSPVRTQSRRPD
jgi:hypothetical protein